MVWVSLEVAIGFVVKLAVCHQFLHAGEGLRAAQGGTAEEFAWQGRVGGQRSGVAKVILGALPASHPNLPPTTYPGPTFQGLCGWAVGTQMLGQVANAGETEAAARAGAGYLLSCRMHTARSLVPSPPMLSRALPQKGIYVAGITYGFLPGPLFCLLH